MIANTTPNESLVGLEMPILANLEPRTIRGHESRGMVMVAIADGARPVSALSKVPSYSTAMAVLFFIVD
jgi:tRNA-binding EMAP/Myf-like protein